MRDDDGFTAAEGWIDQWEAGVAAHAARADELARRVAELAATTPSAERIALIRLAVAQTVGLDSEFGRAVIEAMADVSPEDLDAHARRVDAIADEVQSARDRGATARLSAEVYGPLCVAMPALLAALQDKILDGTADAVDALRAGATRLHAAANGYRGVEPE